MKPSNLIKKKVNSIIASPNPKENLLNAALSLAAGYLSKKAIIGSTHNPLNYLEPFYKLVLQALLLKTLME